MKRFALGLALCALAAPLWANDAVLTQLHALALRYGIDPDPAVPEAETGLERTLMVSVTGEKSKKTFTPIVLGKNLSPAGQRNPEEDHSTSTVEFGISDKFMTFTWEERIFDGMIGFSPFQTWTHRYLCRNYKHASHLVCHVQNTCVSSEKNESCGDKVSFQDFERAKK